jgi:Transposase IS66 family
LEPDVPGAGDECEQRGHKGPIDPRQANPARLPALENGELVAQQQELRVLPRLGSDGEAQPRREPEDEQEHEPKTHKRRSSAGSTHPRKPSSREACDPHGRVLGTHKIEARLEDYLHFAHDPAVPFDNNASEREIRMCKLRIKVSGSMRSTRGASEFCRIRSYLQTTRKHGISWLDALTDAIRGIPWMPETTTV